MLSSISTNRYFGLAGVKRWDTDMNTTRANEISFIFPSNGKDINKTKTNRISSILKAHKNDKCCKLRRTNSYIEPKREDPVFAQNLTPERDVYFSCVSNNLTNHVTDVKYKL